MFCAWVKTLVSVDVSRAGLLASTTDGYDIYQPEWRAAKTADNATAQLGGDDSRASVIARTKQVCCQIHNLGFGRLEFRLAICRMH